jgi:RNA polymerase sigma factor (sigma-70 family)
MEEPSATVCEESVFRRIFDTCSRDLYNFLFYKYGVDNNPEDLMQEAFARLWQHCKTVSPDKARAFLFTVANNQMLNDLARKKTVLTYSKDYVSSGLTNESPHYKLEENEYMERLQHALEALTEEQRVAFMMNRIEGKKQKAVEKRIYKAVESIQVKIGKF